MLSPLDSFGGVNGRVIGQPEPMPYLEAFRSRLLDEKYPPHDDRFTRIRDVVSKLPASDAIDLLAGVAIYAVQPKVGAWRVRLARGAGFYYDFCYAVTDFRSIRTIVIDGTSPGAITRLSNTLIGFPPDQPLW